MIWSGEDSKNLAKLVTYIERLVVAVEKIADIDPSKNIAAYNEWKNDDTQQISYVETDVEQEYIREREEIDTSRNKYLQNNESNSFFEEDNLDAEQLEELGSL